VIIFDVVSKMALDATLTTLLSAATDPKIYPLQAPQEAVEPYIRYSGAGVGPDDEVLDEARVQLTIVSDDYKEVVDIAKRLKALFDLQDQVSIPSDDYYIYYGKLTGDMDVMEPEQGHFEKTVFFNFKYKKKT